MARGTSSRDKGLTTRSKAKADTAKQSAIPLLLLCVLSISYGVFTHLKAVRWGPNGDFNSFVGMNSDQHRKVLGLTNSWPGTRVFDDHAGPVWHFFLVILSAFKKIGVDPAGQALLPLVATCIVPFCSFFIIEGVKDGSHTLISVAVMIIVSSIGQVITIAAASLCLMAPTYAYARWSELKTPDSINPLPSPSTSKLFVITICNIAALLTIVFTSFCPLESEYWVPFNIAFQFFPLCWVPLLFFSKSKVAVSKPSSAAARENPRLSSAQIYQMASYFTVLMYWYGIYHGFEGFLKVIKSRGKWANDMQDLLIWDGIGCLVFDCIVILIDGIVDEAKIKMGARVRTHEKRSTLTDLALGLPLVLLFGPGWGMCTYFQRREIRAEKARFGTLTKVE